MVSEHATVGKSQSETGNIAGCFRGSYSNSKHSSTRNLNFLFVLKILAFCSNCELGTSSTNVRSLLNCPNCYFNSDIRVFVSVLIASLGWYYICQQKIKIFILRLQHLKRSINWRYVTKQIIIFCVIYKYLSCEFVVVGNYQSVKVNAPKSQYYKFIINYPPAGIEPMTLECWYWAIITVNGVITVIVITNG